MAKSITVVSGNIKLRINKLQKKVLTDRANTLVYGKQGLRNLTHWWVSDIKRRMSKPSSSRGFHRIPVYSKKLKAWIKISVIKPHNSSTFNNSFPMAFTGKLRDSIKANVSLSFHGESARIKVFRSIGPTMSASGIDYSSFLNTRHPVLHAYKDRAYKLIDDKIASKLTNRGYA